MSLNRLIERNDKVKSLLLCIFFICIPLLWSGCQIVDSSSKMDESVKAYSGNSALGITAVPESSAQEFKDNYVKYTHIIAPNGKPIHFYAQDRISDEQLVRARSILEWYLTDVPLSVYGANKAPIANNMANNNATLILLNGSDEGEAPTDGQTLFETENVIEGSPAYLTNQPRDAAFEEILHLMHDTGIGVDGPMTFPGVSSLVPFQKALREATYNAMPKGIKGVPSTAAQLGLWAENDSEWLNELAAENSLTQEYLATMIDVYYGLSGYINLRNNPDENFYKPMNRAQMETMDSMGWALIGNKPLQFFSEFVGYTARIDDGFKGTFSLQFDPRTNYTYKSQYLLNAQLTGDLNSNLTGNAQNNRLGGNAGHNILDGGDGKDVALFKGSFTDYTIAVVGHEIHVSDRKPQRDGTTILRNIEVMQFADRVATFEGASIKIEN